MKLVARGDDADDDDAKTPRSIALYADLSRFRTILNESPPRVSAAESRSIRPASIWLANGGVKPGHGIHDANFAHGPLLAVGRSCIRSLFSGEGNHIPRSTVMVNGRSLRAVTEPLPPACTPASVSGPRGCT